MTFRERNVSRTELLSLSRGRRFELARWASLVALVYVAIVVVELLVFNHSWNWSLVWSYLLSQRVMLGVLNTIWLTILVLFWGLLVGLLVCAARLSKSAALRAVAIVYVWIVRATPPLVILLLIYFLAALQPTLGIGLPFAPYVVEWPTNSLISQFTAAVVGLSFYLGGMTAEIFRSGLTAVGAGQREAVRALGLRPRTALVYVTGPQAIRVMIPPMANEVVTIFKNTSLVSVIGYTELLTTVQRLYAINFETIPMLTVACIWYLVLTSVLMVGQMWLERRFARGYDRSMSGHSSDDEASASVKTVLAEVPLVVSMNQEGKNQ